MRLLICLLLITGCSLTAADQKVSEAVDQEEQAPKKQPQRRTSVTRTRTGNKPLKIKMPKQKGPKLKKPRRL
jgi:PBP1b-binding outer membrane lipoprotein LpoB